MVKVNDVFIEPATGYNVIDLYMNIFYEHQPIYVHVL